MDALLLLFGTFLWCTIAEGQLQRNYPYLSFLGQTLPNHAYVDISLIGVDQSGSDSVQCHTNLPTCCRRDDGSDRGDWFAPGHSTRLMFPTSSQPVYEDRELMRVDLRNRNATSPTGLYRCDIDVQGGRKSLYVGLYTREQGSVVISGGMTLNVMSDDLNGDSSLFTLTCISTGGPATTVIWTRDSYQFTEGSESVLVDRVAAKYTHTLTVSGRPEGLYTCNISNNKPSHDSAQLYIEAPPGVPVKFTADESERTVTFSWSAPKKTLHSKNITGYVLSCSPSPSSLPLNTSQSGTITLKQFLPNTLYSCSVSANNDQGSGPPATVSFTTQEDYKFFQIHVSNVQTDCVQYKAENERGKLQNVTGAILSELIASCRNCTISLNIIDEQYFFCDPESPTHVTYRARLEGTAERDSDVFLSIITSWVETGPNITAGGLLQVNPDCPPVISSLTNPKEGVCQIPTAAPEEELLSLQTIAIIAGICGVIALMVLVLLVVVLCLCCKYCCKYKNPPEEKALEGLSGVYIARRKEEEKEKMVAEEEKEKMAAQEESGEQEHEISPQPVLKMERGEEKEDTMDTQLEVTQDTDDKEPVNETVFDHSTTPSANTE